jgi:hypothetical protein
MMMMMMMMMMMIMMMMMMMIKVQLCKAYHSLLKQTADMRNYAVPVHGCLVAVLLGATVADSSF